MFAPVQRIRASSVNSIRKLRPKSLARGITVCIGTSEVISSSYRPGTLRMSQTLANRVELRQEDPNR